MILTILQGTSCSFKFLDASVEKVTVKSLVLPAWRCPTVGENCSCGCSGHRNRTESVVEWLVIENVRVRGSLIAQSPKRMWLDLAARMRRIKICMCMYIYLDAIITSLDIVQ